jgi:transposase InsO family protein
MSQRSEFVRLAQASNVSELCRRFGISRKTGYKWLSRFDSGGEADLQDRSRRPLHSPKRTSDAMEKRVIDARSKYPSWGPRKLLDVIKKQVDDPASLPAPSTISQILLRHGLVDPISSQQHHPWVRFEKEHPNQLWQMDFKGHVAMLNGKRCHPLTVLDDHSRFNVGLIACEDEQTETVKQALIGLLRRYGQPARILCDNGAPWGSGGGEPYTRLCVWLLLHGISVSHGRPYHPQTQGKEERFHRTLNVELLSRETMRDIPHSQYRFDDWRAVYNEVRPHEALGMATPITRWRPSDRAYEENPPAPEYLSSDAVRKVDPDGKLSFKGSSYKIGQAFGGQRVGLRATEVDGVMKVMLGELEVGMLDLRVVSAAMSRAEPQLATLAAAQHGTEKSVTHVSEQVLPLTPA